LRPRIVKPPHPLEWLAEPLLEQPSFVLKSWFGGRTLMLHGLHTLFLTTQGEPWQGVLVCTFHEHQPSLLAEFPALRQHPVLKKWLYLPESSDTFESDAKHLVRLTLARDPRIGIPPSPKKKRTAAARPVHFGDTL